MNWYYLERPTRMKILRGYYAICFFAYPAFILFNLEHYKPKKLDEAHSISVAQQVLNPRGPGTK